MWTFFKKETMNMIPCRTCEILQEWQPLFYRCRPQAGIPATIFSRRRSPRSQSRSWSSTRFLEYSGRLHMLESCCSDDEAQEFRRTIFRYFRITFLMTNVRCLIYLDVLRQTKTSSDVFQEATIDDYWHIDGDKSLSEPWISVTRFALLNKNLPEGYMCVQGRLTKKQVTTRRGTVRPEESLNMSKGSQRTAINQWLKKNQSWTPQENNEAFTAFRTILIMKKS